MSTPPNGWQAPKTNWQAADVPLPADFSRIEGNANAIEAGNRTVDQTQAPGSHVGTLRQFLDWLVNRIKAITGTANWYDVPPTTLTATKAYMDATDTTLNQLNTGKVAKSGDAMTGPMTTDQAAPAVGQVQPYWTYMQAAGNKFRFAMDNTGNLLVQRWTGAAWSTVATYQVGADLILSNVDQVDGLHLRTSGGKLQSSPDGATWSSNVDQVDGVHFQESSSLLQYSLDGTTWKQAGVPRSEVISWALIL